MNNSAHTLVVYLCRFGLCSHLQFSSNRSAKVVKFSFLCQCAVFYSVRCKYAHVFQAKIGQGNVTTASAATMAPPLMVAPGVAVAFAPIHTFLPITIGAGLVCWRRSGSISWLRVASTMLWPIRVPSPVVMPPWS